MKNNKLPERLDTAFIVIGENNSTPVCLIYVPEAVETVRFTKISCDEEGVFLITEHDETVRIGNFDPEKFDELSERPDFRIHLVHEVTNNSLGEFDIQPVARQQAVFGV